MINSLPQLSVAQHYGAIGVIIYSDPLHYAPQGYSTNDTFPNSPWLPPNAVQRLSLINDYGDFYTPLLPSRKGMYRINNATNLLPMIPAQTISYHDAEYILRRMGGKSLKENLFVS